MQETTNLGLNTYEASDPTDWLADFNYNMTKIDEAVGTQNASIATVTATANQANSTATLANTTAENALSTATTANSTATTANETANSALSTASSASETANTALSTASSASETATSASETATSASETATTASETATSALTVANSKASINDSTASSDTTYSSTKIDNLLSNKESLHTWTHPLSVDITTEGVIHTVEGMSTAKEILIIESYNDVVQHTDLIPAHYLSLNVPRIWAYDNCTFAIESDSTINVYATELGHHLDIVLC